METNKTNTPETTTLYVDEAMVGDAATLPEFSIHRFAIELEERTDYVVSGCLGNSASGRNGAPIDDLVSQSDWNAALDAACVHAAKMASIEAKKEGLKAQIADVAKDGVDVDVVFDECISKWEENAENGEGFHYELGGQYTKSGNPFIFG